MIRKIDSDIAFPFADERRQRTQFTRIGNIIRHRDFTPLSLLRGHANTAKRAMANKGSQFPQDRTARERMALPEPRPPPWCSAPSRRTNAQRRMEMVRPAGFEPTAPRFGKIGRASGRERVCQYF